MCAKLASFPFPIMLNKHRNFVSERLMTHEKIVKAVLPFCGFSPQICGIFKVTQSRRGFLCYGQFLWINLWNFLKVMDNFVDFKYFVDFLWAFEFNPSITLL